MRIVAGKWAGKQLVSPAGKVRPTTETLRDEWLNTIGEEITGARILDIFAGSGALGLEALSRGAAHVEFVDAAPRVIRAIREHLAVLREAGKAAAHAADVLAFLRTPPVRPFDIAFLDPPYAAGLLAPACAALESRGWLAPGARIYLEHAAGEDRPPLPPGWEFLREKRAGQVAYCLAARN